MRKFLLPVALALFGPLALAQTQPAGRGKTAPAAPQGPQGVELAVDPFRVESVGLTIYLPAVAQSQRSSVGDQQTVQVVPSGTSPEWMFTIQTPQSRNMTTTAQTVAEDVLEQLKRSVGTLDRRVDGKGNLVEKLASTRAVVLQAVKELRVPAETPERARPAAHFYVKLPGEGKNPAVVRGYTVFRVEPGRFVTFDLTTTEPAYPRAKLAYETSINTVRFADRGTLVAARGAAIESGVAFLSRLTPADFDRAMGLLQDQYFRLSRARPEDAESAAQEVAYRRVRAWKGKRGEIDTSRSPAKMKGRESQEGYLVRIEARLLASGGAVFDTVGVFFMTPDRKEEAWSLQTVIHAGAGKKPDMRVETGARSGLSMSVSISGDGSENRTVQPLVPKQGYLNQVECHLLPQLLMGARSLGEHGFYSYQPEGNTIYLRRDELIDTGDPAAPWRLTTRAREDADPQVSTYDERQELIQTIMPPEPGGAVRTWTRSTLQRLVELWRAKGLPMN